MLSFGTLRKESMWALDAQEASRERRMQRISAQNKRNAANNAPLDSMQRVRVPFQCLL
jgi:hypothetical protein